jgi:hypothetical protein
MNGEPGIILRFWRLARSQQPSPWKINEVFAQNFVNMEMLSSGFFKQLPIISFIKRISMKFNSLYLAFSGMLF